MAEEKYYLGRVFNSEKNEMTEKPVLVDGRDLTTHGVIVGMTGSGKTGLAVGLIEEAVLSGIPCLIIDPKAEMGNLLLSFPDLLPADFAPWVDPAEAERKGKTPEAFAADTAGMWKKGLTDWGIDGERIRRYKDAADFVVYTPGSTASVPINVLNSFAVPRGEIKKNEEAVLELITGSVSALLSLIGIEADPITSREHILLSKIWEDSWGRDQDLNLEKIITFIQDPPLKRVGVFELEGFYPRAERMKLAMMLNNIAASPSFAGWRKGAPLDIDFFFKPRGGKPGVSVFYISHLSDPEREFFVTLLLWRLVTWMRAQQGSSRLRALVYIDEAVGLLPPYPKDPPTKRPIMTLLKQARAYGIGMVLATQNPVDIDYKALTNAGTWFIGRLQTKNDKDRVLEGLTAASKGGVPTSKIDDMISALSPRVFLYHSVREDTVTHFGTRWAMCYLRGPIGKERLKDLPSVPVLDGEGPQGQKQAEPATAKAPAITADAVVLTVPPDIGLKNRYLSPRSAAYPTFSRLVPIEKTSGEAGFRFVPALAARARAKFDDTAAKVAVTQTITRVLFPLSDARIGWEKSVELDEDTDFLEDIPVAGQQVAGFVPLPEWLTAKDESKRLSADFVNYMNASLSLTLLRNPGLSLFSTIGETREAFLARTAARAEEEAAKEVEKITKNYKDKIEALQSKVKKQERQMTVREMEYGERKRDELISAGASVLGLVFGRKSLSGITRASSKRMMTVKSKTRLEDSEAEIKLLNAQITELSEELNDEVSAISEKRREEASVVEKVTISLEKNDILFSDLVILWVPV
ncbi:MAG: ATP-binding protein [Deltaproteobacteria bacterium]|nr:ATP-binding protein [Candidatus Zymogenaceae bacterium]